MVPPPPAASLASPWRRALPAVVVTGGLTAWFVYTVHWGELLATLARVPPGPVLLSAVLLLSEFLIRALRWRVLLSRPVPSATVADLLAATVVGAAANTLLPFRAGELARPLVAARRTGARLSTLVATVVLERVLDLVGLAAVFTAMLLTLPDVPPGDAGSLRLLAELKELGGGLAALGVVLLLGAVVLARRIKALQALPRHLAPWLRPGPAASLARTWDGLLEGLPPDDDPTVLLRALLLSLLLWFNGVLAIAVLFPAFGIPLSFAGAAFVAVAIALSVVLPQLPGFFGVFHVAVERALLLWAIDPTPSKAFAITFWAVSFLPVTACGIAVLWREGLSLADLRRSPAPLSDAG